MKEVKCEYCDLSLCKDEIALNKKLISKNTKQFLCFNCLANHLDTSVEELKEKIEEFKEEGCTLFL